MQCVFLLSPARCSGIRAGYLLNPRASFELAVRLRTAEGITLGEAFTFMSGLYFRGKLAYAAAFGCRAEGAAGLVIVPGRGLIPAETTVRRQDLLAIAKMPVDVDDARYTRPLRRDAQALAATLSPGDQVVLLGSIASGKYTSILHAALGEALRFPAEFVGRGDMSRGGLMLRCARDARPLTHTPMAGATLHGQRPAKLEPIPGIMLEAGCGGASGARSPRATAFSSRARTGPRTPATPGTSPRK